MIFQSQNILLHHTRELHIYDGNIFEEAFVETINDLKTVNCFCQNTPSLLYYSVLNTSLYTIQPFKRQSHKMTKNTQPIRWQQPTICLSAFDEFLGLALKGLVYSRICNLIWSECSYVFYIFIQADEIQKARRNHP